ncbi:MAG: T9SS type A sorting domain-containing protein [Candidatus Cloacimonadales bacterium]|nr:T9SS type A sorting domain-containing protein [Candidatus Cloacimonadales bacterium]
MKKSLVFIVLLVSLSLWSTIGFVVNSGSETLSRIDFETGVVNNVFSVLGSMPNRVELTQEFAYVVNSGDNNVQKINLQTGVTEALIFIGLSTNPYNIIIADDFAYVSGGISNKIYKIDLTTDEVIGSISVGSNPAGMAVLDGKLYVGNTDYANYYANCSVSIIDLQTFAVTNTIPTEVNPQFLAVINDKIHISCGGDWGSISGKICVLDPDTEEITDIIEIGGVTSNFAVTPGNIVYVGDGFGYSLFAYDALDYSIIYGGSNPFTPGGTMVAANNENLYVLGGEWGQNFSVKKYDFEENLLAEYTVALYATDLKLLPENTSVTNDQLPVTNYHLSNYPNPFNPSTTISFNLTAKDAQDAKLEIYNVKGQKIKTFSNLQITNSPNHQITWDGTDQTSKSVSSGVYFYRLKVDGKVVAAKKMLLLR